MRVNEHGILTEPNLHDGFLECLSDNDHKSARIECRSVLNQRVDIRFKGVQSLQGNDFRQGNIIGTIWIYEGSQIPSKDVEHLVFGEDANRDAVNKLISDIQKSKVFLVKMWSSYGLQLRVLCEEVICEIHSS